MIPTPNSPDLWHKNFPLPDAGSHKYRRGHALIAGGGIASTGAARLAATAALRTGAGLVSVICDRESLPVYAASLTAVMTKLADTDSAFQNLVTDPHASAFLIGPGCGVSAATRKKTLFLLAFKKPCVLDADALSVFADDPPALFSALHERCVLTPHEGEFLRIFDCKGDRIKRACEAAALAGAVVVLKGNETIIASPNGATVINTNAPSWLATAGSGDVLAGIITGLLAQAMPAFDAACAGVWLHGQAANHAGLGMISEDLPGLLPDVLRVLFY